MYGAIVGDLVGSPYESRSIKTKRFELFTKRSIFTDDTVMTCAVASAIMLWNEQNRRENFEMLLISEMQRFGRKYPHAGYGSSFANWLLSEDPQPYGSYGNGSAMRVSPIGWTEKTMEDTLLLAEKSASVTHNHSEGIKGAQAVAAAIYMARKRRSKGDIKDYTHNEFYNLDFTLNEIRTEYSFDVSCQDSVPQAIQAFLESGSFEDSIRNAVSLGGDSDTIAAIAGSISEAYYGVPEILKKKAKERLDLGLLFTVERFSLEHQMGMDGNKEEVE